MAHAEGRVARRLLIGLHSPYLGSVYGGGEKYLGVAAEALREAYPEHQLELLSTVPVDAERYWDALRVDLRGIPVRVLNRTVTPLHRQLNRIGALRPLRNLVLGRQAGAETGRYDLLVAMVYGVRLQSSARSTVVLCQFPYPVRSESEVAGFRLVVAQSRYVEQWIRRRWGVDAVVLNPPVDLPARPPELSSKRNWILSIGRFIRTGHSKRQDLLVEVFRDLCDSGLEGWELHLAGAVHDSGPHAGYFESVRERAAGYPIRLHPDAEWEVVQELLQGSALYWHAAGFGVDAERDPEAIEHFGITVVEAMAAGAVPLVFGAGGPAEIVEDGGTGRLWQEPAQLAELTRRIAADSGERERLAGSAIAASAAYDRATFKRRFAECIGPILKELA